jgi:hypothetical protein
MIDCGLGTKAGKFTMQILGDLNGAWSEKRQQGAFRILFNVLAQVYLPTTCYQTEASKRIDLLPFIHIRGNKTNGTFIPSSTTKESRI